MKKTLLALIIAISLVVFMFVSCSDKKTDENAVDTGASDETVVDDANTSTDETPEQIPEQTPEQTPEEEPVPVLDEKIALDPEDENEVVNDLGFENLRLLAGVANALGKTTAEMTQADVDAVKYLAIGPEATGDYTVYVGLMEYAVAYANEMLKEEPSYERLNEFVMMSVIKFDEKDTFADLGRFKNVEIFEYYDVPISDVSFIKEYDKLAFGYFNNNGITDVSCLDGYNPETLRELDFTNNNIQDWSALEHIKSKVIVRYETQLVTDENGNQMYIPFVLTLEDKLEQDKEQSQKADNEAGTEINPEDEFLFSGDDFASLFD